MSHHLLIELFDCDAEATNRVDAVRDALLAAARALRTQVVGQAFHTFDPQGVSGVLLVAESHLSVHTWPECRYVAIDVFTCGEVHPREALPALCAAFGARTWVARDVWRGLVDLAPERSVLREEALVDLPAVRRAMPRPAGVPDPGSRPCLLQAEGVVDVTGLVEPAVTAAVREATLGLLEAAGERRDLRLATTGGTPRHLTVVRSEVVAADPVLSELYRDPSLRATLERVAGERLHDCPRADEQFLITRHHCRGDTHGWHWGDFSYALIWIVEAPPIASGGLLQCVPHTSWDKHDPRILEHLVERPIRTYHFGTGQVYLLRTDTTLHRTVPLVEDTVRVILNMTFAADRDLVRDFRDDDRWWEDAHAPAATAVGHVG